MSKCDKDWKKSEFIYKDIPKTSVRISPEFWIRENKNNFSDFINSSFKTLVRQNDTITGSYHKQQRFVSQYLSDVSPYKSLLLYHGLGSGKTAASILITEGAPQRECIIMLPASLKSNYLLEINKFASFKNVSVKSCLESEYKSEICKEILDNHHWCFYEFDKSMDKKEIKKKYQNLLDDYGIKHISFNDDISFSKEGEYKVIFSHKEMALGSLGITENNSNLDSLSKDLKKKINTLIKKKYKKNVDKNWIFVDNREKSKYLDIKWETEINYPVDSTYGIWVISKDKTKTPNFKSFSKSEQEEILKTLEILFYKKFRFIHYNSKSVLSREILKLLDFKEITQFYREKYHITDKDIVKDKLKRGLSKDETNQLIIYIGEDKLRNPFSNKLIVIDEVHNLISSISGGGYTTKIIYKLLMISNNTKIIGLSGTPSINHPFELGLLFNLLGGNQYLYKIFFDNRIDREKLRHILESIPIIDYFTIRLNQDLKKIEVRLTLNPSFFINKYSEDGKKIGIQYSRQEGHNLNKSKDIELLKNYFIKEDLVDDENIAISLPEPYSLFSLDKEEFTDKYVNLDQNTIRSKDDFVRKIVGKVSFFNEIIAVEDDGGSVFPDLLREEEPNFSVLSNYQFDIYSKARVIEIEDELKKRGKKKKKDDSMKDGGYYRVMSRNALLFAFPPDIIRQWPSTISLKDINQNMINEDLINLEVEDTEKDVEDIEQKDYNTVKTEMLDKLTENDNYLTFDRGFKYDLTSLSPKYVSIFSNIVSSPGLSLCYSQFRSMEGLTIFEKVLEKHGYSKYEEGISTNIDGLSDFNMTRLKINDDFFITCRIAKIKDEFFYFCRQEIEGNIEKVGIDNGLKPSPISKIIKNFHTHYEVENIESEVLNGETFSYLSGNKNYIKIKKELLKDNIFRARYVNWAGNPDILKNFNRVTNKFGAEISIILISMSGAEGISLFNIRQVHIMEPFWNIIKINQVIGRARRISSHANLPILQRNVRVYEYISKFSTVQFTGKWSKGSTEVEENINRDGVVSAETESEIQDIIIKNKDFSEVLKTHDDGITSDENLKDLSVRKDSLMRSFLKLMQDASIDCDYNLVENTKSSGLTINCINTKNLPVIDKNYIYIPGNENYTQAVSKTLISSSKIVISKKKILRIPILNSHIASFLDILPTASTRIPILNIYSYYGLDSDLPGPSFKPDIIGEVEFNEFDEPIFYFNSSFMNDTEQIEKYLVLEETRLEVSKMNSKYREIPETTKVMLEWISLNRELNKKKLVKESIETLEEEPLDLTKITELFGKDKGEILKEEDPEAFLKKKLREIRRKDKENFPLAGKLAKSILKDV